MSITSNKVYRIIRIHEKCEYIRDARDFGGKLVTIERHSDNYIWVTFVNPEDGRPINRRHEWSDKKQYLLYQPILKLVEKQTVANKPQEKSQIQRNNPRLSEWRPVKGKEGIYEINCQGKIRLVKNN